MTQTDNSTAQPNQLSLGKRMLIGAGIGLIAIAFFLIPAGEGDPAWGKLWRIKPLLVTPFAGAMGGLCNYFIFQFRNQFGVNRIAAIILSILVFIVGLWMGIVLGLNGTMWD
jgi:hypothetical protein